MILKQAPIAGTLKRILSLYKLSKSIDNDVLE